MKFDIKKFKLYFFTLLSAVFGTPKERPIKIDIYIEDNIDPEFVKNSLYLIPQLWKFNFLTEAPKYRVMNGEWKGFLIPEADNTVVIFDGKARNAKYAGGCAGKSVGVTKNTWETDELGFGLRIWHELLHAQKIDSDAMLRSPEFEAWLESQFKYILTENRTAYQHSMQFQILFYNFLTRKFVRG
jgi:hypothetical protein